MFDSHAHLNDNRFKNDYKDVIKRAEDAGITGILTIHSPEDDENIFKELINTCLQFSTIQALTGCMDRETKVQQMVAANSLCLRKLCLFLEKRTA